MFSYGGRCSAQCKGSTAGREHSKMGAAIESHVDDLSPCRARGAGTLEVVLDSAVQNSFNPCKD
jgi:hypothetical protein